MLRAMLLRYALQYGVGCLIILMLLAACGASPSAPPAAPATTANGNPTVAIESTLLENLAGTPLQAGDIAPDFSYTMRDGTTYALSDFRGQKVLINFWGIGCPPCLHEMPDIQEVADNNDAVVVLAVNGWGQDAKAITEFAEQEQFTFTMVTDMDGTISRGYQVLGLPVSYFVNSDGTIHTRKLGIMDVGFMTDTLDAMY